MGCSNSLLVFQTICLIVQATEIGMPQTELVVHRINLSYLRYRYRTVVKNKIIYNVLQSKYSITGIDIQNNDG